MRKPDKWLPPSEFVKFLTIGEGDVVMTFGILFGVRDGGESELEPEADYRRRV
jgi:hypothetical protein